MEINIKLDRDKIGYFFNEFFTAEVHIDNFRIYWSKSLYLEYEAYLTLFRDLESKQLNIKLIAGY